MTEPSRSLIRALTQAYPDAVTINPVWLLAMQEAEDLLRQYPPAEIIQEQQKETTATSGTLATTNETAR